MFLKQSTASQEILLGPFLDDTDGKTAETGLTIANTDIKLWKSGGTTESDKNSGGATHIASGRYYAVLDATDTNTVGLLEVSVSVSGALPVRRQFYVLEEAVYDALFGASAAGYQVPIWSSASATVNLSGTTVKAVTDRVTANTDQIAGASVSTTVAQIGVNIVNAGGTAWGSGAITAGSIASNAITSAKLATDCITSAQLASTAITEIQSGLATTANVAAVETDTQDIQSRLPAALVSGRMDSSVGAMASSVLTAAALATDAVAEIADGVYDEAYAGHTTPGTYGFLWDQWRKSNPAITGEVTSAVTPTTTTFSTDITGYANGAFENAVLIFINGSTNADFRGVVSGYVQSNGVVTITPALPQAPVAGDEFTIAIPSFVYTLAQVQSGLATTTQLTTVEGKIDAIDGVTDKLDTTLELDGVVYRFTTNALEQAPAGGGGGTVIVSPLQAVAPDRVSGTEIMTFINDVSSIGPIAVTDADGVAVDLSALTLKVCIEKIDGTILANVTPSVSGVDNNQITFTPNADSVAKTGTFRWSLRRTSNNQVYAYGDFVVDAAARIS